LLLIGDDKELALELRTFCQLLEHVFLRFRVPRKHLQYRMLKLRTSRYFPKYFAPKILVGNIGVSDLPKDGPHGSHIVEGNN
jgi:hypothetical protein